MAKQKDYIAIASKRIVTPDELPPKWRFLVYSRHKKGKTRFGMSAGESGEVLVVDSERGTDKYRQLRPHAWHVTKWEELQEVWGALRTGRLSPKAIGKGKSDKPYAWVSLDTITKINNLALRYVMRISEEANLDRRPGIVDRRDYNKSGELMKELITQFDSLPVGVIYTAQERVWSPKEGQEDDDLAEATTRYVPDLPDGVRSFLLANVDVIGRLYITKAQFKNPEDPEGEPVEKNQRRLWIGDHPQFDTGFRSEYDLPDLVKNPTVPKLVQLMLQGS